VTVSLGEQEQDSDRLLVGLAVELPPLLNVGDQVGVRLKVSVWIPVRVVRDEEGVKEGLIGVIVRVLGVAMVMVSVGVRWVGDV